MVGRREAGDRRGGGADDDIGVGGGAPAWPAFNGSDDLVGIGSPDEWLGHTVRLLDERGLMAIWRSTTDRKKLRLSGGFASLAKNPPRH
jgi:hypothetical protein